MDEPLSLRFRRIVAWAFFFLFLAVLVVTSVYASGYRLGDKFTLERTGGVHVSVPVTGAAVYVNGKEAGVSSFLDRSFFIDNLDFGTYDIEVKKEGYRVWKKKLIVEKSLVTDVSAFLVPDHIALTPVVVEKGAGAVVATTTRVMQQGAYDTLALLFTPATTTPLLQTATTSSEAEQAPDPTELIVRDGNVYVHWNRSLTETPSPFCIRPGACVVEISVELGAEKTEHAEFFRDGVLYQTETGGIYFAEVDVKQPQIVAELYSASGAEFRVYQGEIYIKDGTGLFVVTGL